MEMKSDIKQQKPTSSINITLGAILLAKVNTALTYFSASPNHFDVTIDIEILIKFALAYLIFPRCTIPSAHLGKDNQN